MHLGVHYSQTYVPVAAWESIIILLYAVLRNNWKTVQTEYVLDFTQAPIEMECYTNITKSIEVQSDTVWVLKVNNTIYGKCQAGRVWNKPLAEKLTSPEVRFRQRNIDKCMLYWGKSMYILYTDDYILEGTDEE